MKISKIADAIGYIDDDLIAASIDYKPRKIKMKWLPYAATVACAACFCILAVRISGNIPNNTGIFSDSDVTMGSIFPTSTSPVSEITDNTNGAATSNVSADTANSSGKKPGDSTASSAGNPSAVITGSSKPEDPTVSSGEKPSAYLSTKSVSFSTAKEQVKFVDVKEVSGADFVGYELEYVMPSETLVALRYVYSDGKVSVMDNSGDWGGKIVISPGQWYEKIERDGMVFWKSTVTDPPAAIYISESDVAYFGTFESDADLSKAIDTIKSLI